MKYLYIFKKKNGEFILVEEHIAYEICYEQEKDTRADFLGRILESEFRKVHPQMIRDNKEYRNSLLNGNIELSKAIEDSNLTGGVSDIELDFSSKMNVFGKELEKKMYEELLGKAENVPPDASLNVSTPYGNRGAILGAIKR